MDITITVRNRNITIQIMLHVIRIISNDELAALLKHETEVATDELTRKMKAAYHNQFGNSFTVSDASLAVEIWGHVYADRFAKK